MRAALVLSLVGCVGGSTPPDAAMPDGPATPDAAAFDAMPDATPDAAATRCLAEEEPCTTDAECCNKLCNRPGGGTVGNCAVLGGCSVAGEPCGGPGVGGSCCTSLCLDTGGVGVTTCQRLGGCRVQGEVCASDFDCCSNACDPAGTLADGRTILRCASNGPCLSLGEVCSSGNGHCCPNGSGDRYCVPIPPLGISRCAVVESFCTIPSDLCVTTDECCKDTFPTITCSQNTAGQNVCCLAPGEACAFGDMCCSGVCAPDTTGNLVCGG